MRREVTSDPISLDPVHLLVNDSVYQQLYSNIRSKRARSIINKLEQEYVRCRQQFDDKRSCMASFMKLSQLAKKLGGQIEKIKAVMEDIDNNSKYVENILSSTIPTQTPSNLSSSITAIMEEKRDESEAVAGLIASQHNGTERIEQRQNATFRLIDQENKGKGKIIPTSSYKTNAHIFADISIPFGRSNSSMAKGMELEVGFSSDRIISSTIKSMTHQNLTGFEEGIGGIDHLRDDKSDVQARFMSVGDPLNPLTWEKTFQLATKINPPPIEELGKGDLTKFTPKINSQNVLSKIDKIDRPFIFAMQRFQLVFI